MFFATKLLYRHCFFSMLIFISIAESLYAEMVLLDENGVVDEVAISQSIADGKKAMGDNDLNRAGKIFTKILNVDAKNEQALYYRGLVHLKLGEQGQGIALMEKSLLLQPKNLRLRFAYAKVLEDGGSLDSAIEQYQILLDQIGTEQPESRAIVQRIEAIKRRQLNPSGESEMVIKNISELILAGRKSMKEKKYEEAVKRFEKTLLIAPQNPEALYYAGVAYLKTGNIKQGIEFIENSLTLQPENLRLRFAYGKILEETGEYRIAAEQYKLILEQIAIDRPERSVIQQRLSIVEKAAAEKMAVYEIDRLLDEGQRALSNRLPKKALQKFLAVLDREPDNAKALYFSGVIYIKSGELDKGIARIEKSLTLEPANLRLRFSYGHLLEDTDMLAEAIEQYQHVLDKIPPEADERTVIDKRLVMAQFKQAFLDREKEQMLSHGDELLRRYATDFGVMSEVARLFSAINEFQRAEAVYLDLIKLDAENGKTIFDLARVYFAMEEYEKAEEYFERLFWMSVKPSLLKKSKIQLGLIRGGRAMAENDIDLAQNELVRVLDLDPENIAATLNLAVVDQKKGDLEKAIERLEGLIDRSPNNFRWRLQLADLYVRRGKVLDGIAELDYIIEHGSDSPFSQQAKKVVENMKTKVEEEYFERLRTATDKLATLSDFLKLNPDDFDANFEMGEFWFEQSDHLRAQQSLERAVSIEPENGKAYRVLGDVYKARKLWNDSSRVYSYALSLESDDEKSDELRRELLLALGELFFVKGEYKKAEDTAKIILEDNAGDIDALRSLGRAYERNGELVEAIRTYKKLIEIKPDDLGSRMAIAFLYGRYGDEKKAIPNYRYVLRQSQNERVNLQIEGTLDSIRKRINGYSYNIGYSLTLDDNFNIVDSGKKSFEYYSGLSAGATYNYKINRAMGVSAGVSTNYTIYHVAEFDFINIALTPTYWVELHDYRTSFSVTRSSQSSVLRPEQSTTRTDKFSASLSKPGSGGRNYSLRLGLNTFSSNTSPFFDADTLSLSLDVQDRLSSDKVISYGYTLTDNINNLDLGEDYAYVSHKVNGRFNKRFESGLNGYIDAAGTYYFYKNNDSFANFFGVLEARQNINIALTVGFSYSYTNRINFSGNYRFINQESSLPLGVVFNSLQAAVGRHSASLGSYQKSTLGVSARISF